MTDHYGLAVSPSGRRINILIRAVKKEDWRVSRGGFLGAEGYMTWDLTAGRVFKSPQDAIQFIETKGYSVEMDE